MAEKLLIGWAEADVTPKMDKYVSLSGQYYARFSKEIHSRLKFTCAAFSQGKEQFVVGTLDIGEIVGCVHEAVGRMAAELEPALDPSRIFINAIHTHTAPAAGEGGPESLYRLAATDDFRPPADEILTPKEYMDFIVPIMARAIADAWQARKPGGIARAFGNARIGHCRRAVYRNGTAEMYGDTTRPDFTAMEAGEDTGVEMLFTCDESGKKTGMMLNVACPSQVMEATYKLSSDFAGATRERLKEEFGSDFHTLYQISPAGCQSPRDLVRHYEDTEPDFWHEDGVVELSGRLVAAVRAAKVYPVDYAPVLKSTVQEVTLPRRKVSYVDYEAAKAELARLEAILPEGAAFDAFCAEMHANEKLNGPGPYDSKLHHFVLIKNAKAVVARYEDQDAKPNVVLRMNTVRLGDIAIANNPFELYLYYGQIIKARSRAKQTFLIQLSGSQPLGYLPSPDGAKFGGYGGCVVNGQCGPDAGFKLADATVAAINALFD